MIYQWINELTGILREGGAIAPLVALLGGFLTSLNPCSLSTLPLMIGLVGMDTTGDRKRTRRIVIAFVLGMILTFTLMGLIASALGRMLNYAGKWWYLILGVLMLLMALETWGILNILPKNKMDNPSGSGILGAVLTGVLAGVFASPCATPMMIALMTIIAGGGVGPAQAVLLFLSYAVGHSILVGAAGMSVGLAMVLRNSTGYQKLSLWIRRILGALILLLGLYMLYMGF